MREGFIHLSVHYSVDRELSKHCNLFTFSYFPVRREESPQDIIFWNWPEKEEERKKYLRKTFSFVCFVEEKTLRDLNHCFSEITSVIKSSISKTIGIPSPIVYCEWKQLIENQIVFRRLEWKSPQIKKTEVFVLLVFLSAAQEKKLTFNNSILKRKTSDWRTVVWGLKKKLEKYFSSKSFISKEWNEKTKFMLKHHEKCDFVTLHFLV